MTIKVTSLVGRFARMLSLAFRRGRTRQAPVTHRGTSHADLPPCPGAYALLVRVARR